MKKTAILIVMLMLLSLVLAGVAAANEAPATTVEPGYEVPLAEKTESGVIEEGPSEEDYVGKDMELKEGEMGITSVQENTEAVEEDYVGKGVELKEGQMGITSVATEDGEKASSKLPLYGGILVLAGALSFFAYKKVLA